MSLPISVGDVLTVATLAWNVYKSCKNAPQDFQTISDEVSRLHIVLKETSESLEDATIDQSRVANLSKVADGCRDVLMELNAMLSKYQSLGAQSRRTFDRLRWAQGDVEALRLRIVSNTTMLVAFNTSIQTSSMSRLERKLDDFMAEFRAGRREGSVISTMSVEDVDYSDDLVWRRLRSELEDIGVSPRTIDEKRSFIVSWFAQALKSGRFEEDSDGVASCDDTSSRSEGDHEDPNTDGRISTSVAQGNHEDHPANIPVAYHKLVIVGDGGCGKTPLLMSFRGLPYPNYIPTVFECYKTNFTDANGKCVEITLWDTSGLEDYYRLRPLSYPDTDVFLVTFGIDQPYSLENVHDTWIPEVTMFAPGVPLLLVGLKSDLRNDPRTLEYLQKEQKRGPVSIQEGEQAARELGCEYMECSTITGEGVQEVLARANQLAADYRKTRRKSKKRKAACVVQ